VLLIVPPTTVGQSAPAEAVQLIDWDFTFNTTSFVPGALKVSFKRKREPRATSVEWLGSGVARFLTTIRNVTVLPTAIGVVAPNAPPVFGFTSFVTERSTGKALMTASMFSDVCSVVLSRFASKTVVKLPACVKKPSMTTITLSLAPLSAPMFSAGKDDNVQPDVSGDPLPPPSGKRTHFTPVAVKPVGRVTLTVTSLALVLFDVT
jgi:hypothetical protein